MLWARHLLRIKTYPTERSVSIGSGDRGINLSHCENLLAGLFGKTLQSYCGKRESFVLVNGIEFGPLGPGNCWKGGKNAFNGSVESLSSPGSPGTGRRSSSHLLLLVRFHVDFRVHSVECGMGRIFLLSFFFFLPLFRFLLFSW